MKNNNDNQIKQARANKLYRDVTAGTLVNIKIVHNNQPKPRRRRDYTKKIMHDPLVFTI